MTATIIAGLFTLALGSASAAPTCEAPVPTPITTIEAAAPIEPATACAPVEGAADVVPVPDSLEIDYCPATEIDGALPDWQARPHRRGYCRCSCGFPCETSADCGGSSCDKFITCC